MIEQEKIKEIKKLIKEGFDLDLISFELEIPIEQVRQCKREMEELKRKNLNTNHGRSAMSVIAERNAQAHEKMKGVRERYISLFLKSNTTKSKERKPLSQKERELIETAISIIEERMTGIQDRTKRERRGIGLGVLEQVKKIEGFQLTIEQAEKLYTLISSEHLKGLRKDYEDRIDFSINLHRKRIINQFVESIKLKQEECEDIEELKGLRRKMTVEMEKESPLLVNSTRREITNRIEQLQKKNAIDRIRNNISANISAVITDLVSGNIDMKKANEIIDEEAKNRVASKPKTKFSLTEEAERRQILLQIRTGISEKADIYKIENPEAMVAQLQELCRISVEEAVRIVATNLISIKDFKTAKSLCDKFSDKDTHLLGTFRKLKDDITKAEFGDLVLRGIKDARSVDEERAYIEMIEKALASGNITLEGIHLGKSSDGLRDITLADVWTDQEEKKHR